MPSSKTVEEYQFLVFPESALSISIGENYEGLPQIEVRGNRRGMISLAGTLLWLHANSWREFLSLTGLSFVEKLVELALSIRVTDDHESRNNDCGILQRVDKDVQFEWRVLDY